MMSNSTHFRPRFDVHGLKSCHNSLNIVNQAHLQPQFFQNTYPNNNRLLISPIFQPNNPHIHCPINFSLEHKHESIKIPNTFISEVPIMPRDPEMLKNIDLLSSSVVKEGLNIEKMTQEKEGNNPKFGFLFESEPGTEAAVGKKYYEWKKNALQATFHPQHQSQAPPFLSNHCCSLHVQVTQKETFDSLDEDSFSSRGIDMEIEDDYGGSSTIYVEESKKIEKLENESTKTNPNTLKNYKMNNETSKELLTINKVEDALIAKEDIIELDEENNPHSNNYQNINGLHQTKDDNKIEDNQKVASRCCNETLQHLIYIERNNALIETPLEKSFEIEDKNIESYEKINVSGKDVEQNSISKLKNNDALEMDSIETINFLNEENFLEIKKLKSKDSLSYVNEEEDHCCFNLHESNEVVINIPLVSPTTNTIKQRSINAVENFESKDFVSTFDVEENSCVHRPEVSNEIVRNQHMESRSIDINSQVDMDAIKSSVISKNPISSNVTTSKSNKIILDEYGRIRKNGGNYSSSDVEDRHLIDLRKNTSEDSLKIHDQTIINQNHKMQSANRSLSPISNDEKNQRRLQRYGTKWNILPSKIVDHEKNTCKNYDHDYQNVNDDNNVKKKRFGKCKFYARGHCRRGHHCWFEHSTSKIDEKYDKQYNEGSNKNPKHKSWQVITSEYCSGNTSSSSNIKKQDERSEHSLSLNKKIDYNEIQSQAFDDYNYKESEIYLEDNKFVNKYHESDSPNYKMKQNKRFKYDMSLDKKMDYNKVESKAFDDNNYEESKTFLEENRSVSKSHESGSSNYSINSEKELNVSEGKNKQESWQENVEENSDSCNGCSNIQGKDSKEYQENKQKAFEKNIDNSEGLSNYSDCKKCKIYSKHDEIQIKPTKDIEDTKKLDYNLQKNKSLLLDTTTSSDHLSAVSSTASLDYIVGESSVISRPIQTSTEPQVSHLPNIEALSTETSLIPKISQILNFTTPIKTSILLQDPQISNQIRPMQPPMPLQPPQISNLTMPHGNNQREILSSTPLATNFGSIPNSTSLNAFAPKQTSMQTNMSLLPSSTNPSAVYSPSLWYNPPHFSPSRNINVLPPNQYSKICTPVPQNFRIQQDNIMQPSHFLQTTSTTQRNDQFLLPSLSNSQNILQNIKYPLLQSDYNTRLQHPIQPYNYVQSSMLNKLPQQNQYIINSIPQNTYSSQLQKDLQPGLFRGPSSSNVMQFMNQRFPTPTPNLKYNSLLTPTMAYSIRPKEASILQQNYVVPPPPPLPLEHMLSTKHNTFDSYPSSQIYSSLYKPYIGSETLINKKYDFTNSHPTTITTLPSQEPQNSKHDILQPYTIATPTFENVSPIGEGGQSWTETKGDKTIEGTTKKASKHKQKKCQSKVRGLTLLRKNIGGYAKELLKPKWQEGIMTKEAFKTIVKKTVDKVTRTIKSDLVPNNEEKVTSYMNSARPKILRLVQGYLRKYVKD